MTYTEKHLITLTKHAQRRLQNKVIDSDARKLMDSVLGRSMTVRGWSMELAYSFGEDGAFWYRKDYAMDDATNFEHTYTFVIEVTFSREDGKKPETNEFASIVRTMAQRSSGLAFGRWNVTMVDGGSYVVPEDDDISANVNADLIGYVDVEIPDDFEEHFSHLFGRDAHVARVRAALEAAIMSDWRNRYNVVLAGPPGCGKSDICASLRRALGDDAVMEYDATATTAAGAIKDLAEREILPRVLVIEEVEKTDEKSLSYLMALCDTRGEIRKTTARTHIQRDVHMLVIATVNDMDLFRKMASGALASRFANVVGFSRPSREQLAMILDREVKKIGGDPAWIKPTLDYCEERDITDPRQVIALCMCGREKLVDGSYQRMLADTAL